MKFLPLLPLLLLVSAQPVATNAPATPAAHELRADDPPPLDCPMCGGNVELHQKRTRFLLDLQGSLLLWGTLSSATPF